MAETGTGAAGASMGASGASTSATSATSAATATTAAATGANGVTGAGNANMGSENGKNGANNANGSNSDIERLIQSAVDRATQRLGTDNKDLREQLEALQRQNMTEAEKHAADIKKRETDVARREAELKAEKNRMYALTAIKNANLDDGGTTALELVDLVMADDEKGIDARVKSLGTLVNKLVQAEVDKTFKANGRNPQGAGGGAEDKTDKKSEFARELGKKAAAESKKSRGILDQYLGR